MTDLIPSGEQHYLHCYKCCLQMTPDLELSDGHCPRCGYDQTIIDLSDEVATQEQLRKKQALKEQMDLQQMVGNWATAFTNLIPEKGVDWSFPHELVEEIGEIMMPWIARLVQSGHFKKEEVRQISAVIDHEVGKLIQALDQEEELLRLTGQWDDKEQEIKDHWEKRFQKAHGLEFKTYLQLPMRNE